MLAYWSVPFCPPPHTLPHTPCPQYYVKRAGMGVHEYGTVDAMRAKQQRLMGAAPDSEEQGNEAADRVCRMA